MNSSAAEAFSKQAAAFDDLNASNAVSRHLRDEFRREVLGHLKPQSRLLELNCGTGLDAMYFASHGHSVLATDAAEGMLDSFRAKLAETSQHRISLRKLDFNDLHFLHGEKFDHIVSNFGGLNCAGDLATVLQSLDALLWPGGKVTLMIMPRVCPWELAMALRGKFKTAFRRLKGYAPAHIEGVKFTCYYYNPGYVKKAMRNFRAITLRGICITVPPEFYAGFGERFPRLFRFLKKVDRAIGETWPFNRWCDHYLVTLEKRG